MCTVSKSLRVAVWVLLLASGSSYAEVLACYGVGSKTNFVKVGYVSPGKPVGWYGGVGLARTEFDSADTTSRSASVSGGVTFDLGSGVLLGVGAAYQRFEVESDVSGIEGSDAGVDAWLRPGGRFGNLVLGFRISRESGSAASIGWMF